VDLVDCDVEMQIIGVVMNGADPLMLAKAQSLAQARFDGSQGFRLGFLAGAKAHDQMIGFVCYGAGV
jgi:hypothetical protein